MNYLTVRCAAYRPRGHHSVWQHRRMGASDESTTNHTVSAMDAVATTGLTISFKPTQLSRFVAVADEGQITRAAQKLHMAQPALSQSISQLEAQVGAALFERNARGVKLTAAGAGLSGEGARGRRGRARRTSTAQALARSAQGTIVFGHTSVPPWLADPQLIESFTETHPRVQIKCANSPSP